MTKAKGGCGDCSVSNTCEDSTVMGTLKDMVKERVVNGAPTKVDVGVKEAGSAGDIEKGKVDADRQKANSEALSGLFELINEQTNVIKKMRKKIKALKEEVVCNSINLKVLQDVVLENAEGEDEESDGEIKLPPEDGTYYSIQRFLDEIGVEMCEDCLPRFKRSVKYYCKTNGIMFSKDYVKDSNVVVTFFPVAALNKVFKDQDYCQG